MQPPVKRFFSRLFFGLFGDATYFWASCFLRKVAVDILGGTGSQIDGNSVSGTMPMNDDFSPQNENPYAASYASQTPDRPAIERSPLPTYCVTIFIISIILCCIRALLAMLTTTAVMTHGVAGIPNFPAELVLSELITNWGIPLFGIPGNALMLMKVRFGLYLSAICVIFVIASIGVSLLETPILMKDIPKQPGVEVGFYIGAGAAVLFRVALLGLLVSAMLRFDRWQKHYQGSNGAISS